MRGTTFYLQRPSISLTSWSNFKLKFVVEGGGAINYLNNENCNKLTSLYFISLLSHIVYSNDNFVELEEVYFYVCRNNFLTYILYDENLLEKFNPIHFTNGTDVEFTF